MIVDEVDVECIPILEAEHDPPVSRHGYAPVPFEFATQAMDPPAREKTELAGPLGGVYSGENSTKPRGQFRRNPALVLMFVEALKSLVTKA